MLAKRRARKKALKKAKRAKKFKRIFGKTVGTLAAAYAGLFCVFYFDLDGKLLAVYGNITEAARENNVSQTCIANAIYNGTKYNMSHNYIWLRETMKDTVFDVIEKRKSDMRRESRIKKTV